MEPFEPNAEGRIRLFAMDVDGTLTDGRLYIGERGEVMKAFDVKDGYGIVKLRRRGVVPVMITSRRSAIVAARAVELGVTELHQGVEDKLACLRAIAERYGAAAAETAYIGDDENDLPCLRWCGLSAAPADAVEAVRAAADYVCVHAGGRGAVREFAERVLGEDGELQ